MKNKHPNLVLENITDISQYSGISKNYILNFVPNNYRDFNNKMYYRSFSISKKTRGNRELHSPMPTLNILQSFIKKEILDKHPENISKYAYAYIPNKSIKNNAIFHRSSAYVIKLDIKDFFGNIDNKKIFNLFKRLGYPANVSSTLSVISSLDGQSIPQGSVTSPQISNMVMFDFDNFIGSLANDKLIKYTRYADDMTISGNDLSDLKLIKKIITKELGKLGFELNLRKQQILLPSQKQRITGITANSVLNADIKMRKNVRLEIHHYLSPHSKNHLQMKLGNEYTIYDHIRYARSLLGKINFIIFINGKNKDYYFEARNKIIKILDKLMSNSKL
ncbi:reverse transcriptase domain-containing protein [Weissella paramesenteroides]|uniref:reverse transcriptase domain-containing protein n=1 Tax=Weissella paramesenteroides TaxID=1249 RepID=UPI003F22A6D4